MKKRYSKVFAIMVLFAFLGTSMVGVVTAEEEPFKEIEAETGTSTEFDGGDYVFIRFNKDAAFGVLYGTEDNPNSIVVVAIHVRYLGGAEVYDNNGAKMGNTVPIPVITVFAQKLEDIFEYNDTNDDGVCNYRRWGFGLEYNNYFMHEPIYKQVSLKTSWERSEITKETDAEARTKSWSFDLSANDLPYRAIGDSSSIDDDVENEVLDKVQFTFHLSAKAVQYDNISVPMYKVTVRKASGQGQGPGNTYEIMNSERIQDREFSGVHGNYVVKYDHLIDGWDMDPTNSNPSLLLEWHAIVGNLVPTQVESWIRTQFIQDIDNGADLVVETEEGKEQYNEEGAMDDGNHFLEDPRKVRTNHIQSGADWSKVGRLTWVSDVEVDGEEGKMYAQVQGAKRLSLQGEKGKYYGYALLAGFSYPGGEKVFHDPGISNSIPISIDFGFDASKNLKGLIFIVGLTAVIGLIAVVGVAYTIRKGKKGRNYYNGAYDVTYKEQPRGEDWQRYYKKR